MRPIKKGLEPTSLATHRAKPQADFENYREKDDLRTSLVMEQRGLCCYCMSSIKPDSQHMKIEHWQSQSTRPDMQIVYRNLLGACCGNDGQPRIKQHCDTYKGNLALSKDPTNLLQPIDATLRFGTDGQITSSDPVFDAELNDVLNLNEAWLKNNRREALNGFTQSLARMGTISPATLNKWLSDWDGQTTTGRLNPFCQVIVHWLQKRLGLK